MTEVQDQPGQHQTVYQGKAQNIGFQPQTLFFAEIFSRRTEVVYTEQHQTSKNRKKRRYNI